MNQIAQLDRTEAAREAFAVLADVVERANRIRDLNPGDLTAEEASQELRAFRKLNTELKDASVTYARFPDISLALDGVAEGLFYEVIHHAPIFTKENRDAIENRSKKKRIVTYFLKHPDTGLIKIGKTQDLKQRLTALCCGSGTPLVVVKTLQGDRESEMHKLFREYKYQGEWFHNDNGALEEAVLKTT